MLASRLFHIFRFKRAIQLIMLIACFTFTSQAVAASPELTFTPSARLAYDYIMQLRFAEARKEIAYMRKFEKDNYLVYFLENYIDFFQIFISEERTAFNALKGNKEKRLTMLRKADRSSPYYLFTQAEVQLQWALARLKFGEYIRAFYEVKNAYELLEKNNKKYPSFKANQMTLGVLHAIVGSIPSQYQWGVKILGGGMKGSLEQGAARLEDVIRYARNNAFIFKEEAVTMYAFTMLNLMNKPEQAWNTISRSNFNTSSSPLATFAVANIAMRSGRNDHAIRILRQRPYGKSYYPFYYLDYMLGVALLNKLSPDASKYLTRYVTRFKGRNYIKDAYQKLAWSALIAGNTVGYRQYISQVAMVGYTDVDEDKSAQSEAKTGDMPQPELLKARLLFDGGYYENAEKILADTDVNKFTRHEHVIEYYYRYGRITHAKKEFQNAIKWYKKTLDNGKNNPAYFACSAALNLGLIYEEQKNKSQASHYFQICLDLQPNDYKSSLHQKAEAGLNRIN